ncbi:unnamed protein product (macronuclear) [Paramecium tetraurelia]|uniref:Uncharacterized protein n=1 Tax=Paramecium tetraurelia TaxID=5888 RepID=A0EFL9_PARTE|nr:uncharacterized protein GSPATT00026433001 [Paramecium tetraurelia]CAK94110.1 unnamed protein product [Paramecium tetraurelia]|eukprot:XP_001461483.1 hypothetical protein (macronuclear) [Paramecium tetraurelia strain d4-2]
MLDQQIENDSPKVKNVELAISNNEFQILKISTESTSYETRSEQPQGMRIKTLEYQFKLDDHFNQLYRCTLQQNNQIIIYEKKTKKIYFQGNTEKAPKDAYFSSEHITKDNQGQYYFNQLITKEAITQESYEIIDAFAQYLNQQNLNQYIKDNSNQAKKGKTLIFFPSSILNQEMNQKQFMEKYQNYVFQYEQIKYDLELIYENLFFITTSSDNREYFYIELNFSNSIMKIHLLNEKQTKYYQRQIELLQGLYPKFTQIIICAQCKLNKNSKQPYLEVCMNMLRESQNKELIEKIKQKDQLLQHLQSLINL